MLLSERPNSAEYPNNNPKQRLPPKLTCDEAGPPPPVLFAHQLVHQLLCVCEAGRMCDSCVTRCNV